MARTGGVRKRRKPFAVYILLMDGEAWCYERFQGIVEAWATAKTLRGELPLFQWKRVWIEHVDQPAHITRGHFPKSRKTVKPAPPVDAVDPHLQDSGPTSPRERKSS